jgi:hypothetical protein
MSMRINGIPVQDADEPLVLHIRTPDTKTGAKDPEKCAAAKAACRIPGVILAKVYRTRTYLLKGSGKARFYTRYLTPDSLRSEIVAFDRGGTFAPGDYELPAPPKSMKIGAKGRGAPTGPHRKLHRPPHVVTGIRPRGPTNRHGS